MQPLCDATFPATNRRSRPRAVLMACLAFLLASAGIAAALPWASHGPVGGNGTAIAIDPTNPTTMYAGTNGGGFFKTSDGGATWSAINQGVSNVGAWNVEALVVDPATPGRVHAAVSSGLAGGVFTTTDGGASWTLRSFGFLFDLAIDPLNPTTLWAAGGALYRSTDAGANWTQVRSGTFLTVTVDPSSSSTVYAGTPFGSIDRTTDGGANWTTASVGASDHVAAIAVDPTTSAIVYAGLEDFGVYKSDDGGDNWTALGPTVGAQKVSVEDLAIDPANPAIVYAAGYVAGIAPSVGVYRSTDGGTSWNETPLVALVRALALDAANPSTLVAATQDGIGLWKTTDGGAAWSVANDGLVNTNVGDLATAPSAPAVVYAATSGHGVLRSGDGGGTWDATAFTGLLGQFVSLAVDPTSEQTVYLGTEFDSVYKTVDGGASWSPVSSGTLPLLIDALAVDPTNPLIVYAGGFGGVARSTIGGGNWTLVNDGLSPVVRALAIDPTAPGTLYAGTDALLGPFTGVYKTTNSGDSWSPVNAGLPTTAETAVQALAIDPAAPETVYAALERGGVYKTTDGGTSWTEVNNGLEIPDEAVVNVLSLAVDPVLPDTVYAATAGWGVFATSNGGASWAPINLGLYNQFVRSVAVEPGRLYAGTAANGAFVNEISTAPAETILGRSFVVQNPSEDDASRRKITVVASESGSSLTFDVDHLLANGATLTVSAEGQQLLSQSLVLPATAWKQTATGAKYADRKGLHGPAASVVLTRSRSGTVKLTAKLLGKLGDISVVPPDPGTAGGVRLDVNGGPTYCVAFGGAAGGVVVNQGSTLFRVVQPTAEGCP